MNALYLCSAERGKSESPAELRSELYRGNRIEGPDTVLLRFTTGGGTGVFIILTHANGRENGPSMHLECEKGKVFWQTDNGRTFIRYNDGRTEEFDNLTHDNWRFEGFRDLVAAVHEGRDPLCTPELARAQTLAVNAMHESCPEIGLIPESFVTVAEDWEMFPPGTKGIFHRVRGLDEYISVAYEERAFFSELAIPWARDLKCKTVSIRNYTHFPSRGC
jgi:hypothetical protein